MLSAPPMSVQMVRNRGYDPLGMVGLRTIMGQSEGNREVAIGLIDGPVATDHPDLADSNIHHLDQRQANRGSDAHEHGTYIAGFLAARRSSPGPAICPNCTVLVRPIFLAASTRHAGTLSASPDELADAIVECVDARAQVLNLSLAVNEPSAKREQRLAQALNYAAQRGVLVVAAAGNQGTVGGSAITQHPWVIAVAACDVRGRPMQTSNLSSTIGRRGLMAPGQTITSLDARGGTTTSSGTSAAVPFVTGSIALLRSIFPSAEPTKVKTAIVTAFGQRRSVVPPLLNATAAYQFMVRA